MFQESQPSLRQLLCEIIRMHLPSPGNQESKKPLALLQGKFLKLKATSRTNTIIPSKAKIFHCEHPHLSSSFMLHIHARFISNHFSTIRIPMYFIGKSPNLHVNILLQISYFLSPHHKCKVHLYDDNNFSPPMHKINLKLHLLKILS
jgi:hypothetical protein